jgi:hypothetical protein
MWGRGEDRGACISSTKTGSRARRRGVAFRGCKQK